MRAWLPIFGLNLLLGGCAPPAQTGRLYAYGLDPKDKIVEPFADKCGRSCERLTGDRHLVCLSHCPGFVAVRVDNCEAVSWWTTCTVTREPPPPPSGLTSGDRVALGVFGLLVHFLGAAAKAIIYDTGEENDEYCPEPNP